MWYMYSREALSDGYVIGYLQVTQYMVQCYIDVIIVHDQWTTCLHVCSYCGACWPRVYQCGLVWLFSAKYMYCCWSLDLLFLRLLVIYVLYCDYLGQVVTRVLVFWNIYTYMYNCTWFSIKLANCNHVQSTKLIMILFQWFCFYEDMKEQNMDSDYCECRV
jgi:hypothetical protein